MRPILSSLCPLKTQHYGLSDVLQTEISEKNTCSIWSGPSIIVLCCLTSIDFWGFWTYYIYTAFHSPWVMSKKLVCTLLHLSGLSCVPSIVVDTLKKNCVMCIRMEAYINNCATDSKIQHQSRGNKGKKKINWTSSKLKAFVYQRTLLRKGKDNLENRRKNMQIMSVIRI